MIPEETIEQVRDTADIVGLIGESVELKRTGSDYRAPCPFHGGTHRNFAVIPKKGRYYCFVCHESGDVFSWLMKRFGMDYPTAVREMARRCGITIPERPGRTGPDPLEPLFGAVAAAHDWLTRQLLERPEAKVARDYLEGRSVPIETAAMYGLGFAPGGSAFLEAMSALGLKDEVLLEAGLIIRRDDGSVAPRFRGRLLFPIHDLRGRVVGFGGRLLGPGEPKYLNSPETPIFHKGRQLYNLHQAKSAIRKEEMVILVEGYFDVLRLVLGGIEHVVAPLGTALTSDQAALLKRYAPAATLLYDSDRAGLRATFRAGDELLRQSIRVRVATLPPGEDPDTLVQAGGAAALEPIARDAIDVLERKIQLLERKGWFDDVEHQRAALDRLIPTIRAAADPITRELYLKIVSERSGVSREVLQRQIEAKSAVRPEQGGAYRRPPTAGPGLPQARLRLDPTERSLLRVLLRGGDWLTRAITQVPPEWFETASLREIYEAMRRSPETIGTQIFLEQLSEEARKAWTLLNDHEPQYGDPDADQTYVDCVRTLQARPLAREWTSLARRNRRVSSAEYESLVSEKKRLNQEISTLSPEELIKRHMRKGDLDAR